jgi:hypothetical protein
MLYFDHILNPEFQKPAYPFPSWAHVKPKEDEDEHINGVKVPEYIHAATFSPQQLMPLVKPGDANPIPFFDLDLHERQLKEYRDFVESTKNPKPQVQPVITPVEIDIDEITGWNDVPPEPKKRKVSKKRVSKPKKVSKKKRSPSIKRKVSMKKSAFTK